VTTHVYTTQLVIMEINIKLNLKT